LGKNVNSDDLKKDPTLPLTCTADELLDEEEEEEVSSPPAASNHPSKPKTILKYNWRIKRKRNIINFFIGVSKAIKLLIQEKVQNKKLEKTWKLPYKW
jgi:hypothetical protein